jgi:hypothetical protein
MPGKHALLSPSAAGRWLNCTAAPRLEAEVPDNETEYALEGTLAHAYCARKLKSFMGLDTSEEDKEIEQLNGAYHTGEMDEHTDTYKTIVLEKWNAARAKTRDAQLLVETRLDFTKHIPEAFGTADAVVIADGLMEIIDFKYGKGVKVSATENPQMMIYALGAYETFSFEYNIERVKMTIVQPRIDNLSEYELSVDNLLAWAKDVLAPAAREAFSGNGHQRPGKWCRFCKVKCNCRALAENCVDMAREYESMKLITAEDMATKVLPWLSIIKSWCCSVEEYALQQAMSGVNYDGYKVVEGRSNRVIKEPQKVMTLLYDAGYPVDSYMKPSELRSITDLEKNIGRKTFNNLCGDLISKPQGKPTLVEANDKRPAFNAAADDFSHIGE